MIQNKLENLIQKAQKMRETTGKKLLGFLFIKRHLKEYRLKLLEW